MLIAQISYLGKSVSGQNRIDIAQSFKPGTNQASTINKISLKLKKFGTPANLAVKITRDSGGKPDKNNVLTTGTLASNMVTTEYGYVDVSFISNATLQPDTTYWIVLDTASSNNNNYWSWQLDTLGSYTRGSGSWAADWTGNTYTSVGGDLAFKTYMGGIATRIEGSGGSVVQGNVYANTVTASTFAGLSVAGNAHFQTVDSNVRVHGNSCFATPVNTYCHPGVTPQDIDVNAGLSDDLGLGPVEMADLLAAISQKFGVNFNSSELATLKTVHDLVVSVEDLSLE